MTMTARISTGMLLDDTNLQDDTGMCNPFDEVNKILEESETEERKRESLEGSTPMKR